MYGKLVDGEFILAPKSFVEEITHTRVETYVDEETGEEKTITYDETEEVTVIGFTEEYMRKKGYKPVILAENPSGKYTEDIEYIYQEELQ